MFKKEHTVICCFSYFYAHLLAFISHNKSYHSTVVVEFRVSEKVTTFATFVDIKCNHHPLKALLAVYNMMRPGYTRKSCCAMIASQHNALASWTIKMTTLSQQTNDSCRNKSAMRLAKRKRNEIERCINDKKCNSTWHCSSYY